MSEINNNYLKDLFIDEVKGALHDDCISEEKVEEKIRQAQIGGDGEVDLSMYAKATEVAQLKSDLNEKQPKGDYATKSELSREESARKVEIAVERSRIDNFIALPGGSTTGDAEITDARVDFIGETWDSTGDHIRGVTDILPEQFDSIANNESKYVLFKRGYISVSTGIENNSIKRGVITPTFFEKGEIYLSDYTNYALRLFQYDKDGNFIKYIDGIPQRYNLPKDGYIYKLMVFERATGGNNNPSKEVLDDMMKNISITFQDHIKTLAYHGKIFSDDCIIKNNTTYSQCKFMGLSLEGNFENVKFVNCDFVMTRIVGKLRNVVIDRCRFIGNDARIQTTEMYNCIIVNNDFPIDSDEYSVTPKTKGESSRNIFARVMNKCRIQNNHIYIGRTGICCLGEQTILNDNKYDHISSCDNIITGNIVDGIGEEHISFDASPLFDVGKIVDVSINFVEVGTGQIINGQGDNSEQTKIVARTTISMKTDLVGTHAYNDTKHIKNYANMLKGLHVVSLKDSKNYEVNAFALTGSIISDSDGLSFSNEGTYTITVDIPTIYNYYNAIDDEKKNNVINNIKSDLADGDFLYIGGIQSNNIISHNTINGIGTDTITSISDMGGIVLYGVCLNNVISDNILNQKRIWLIEWNNKSEAYMSKVKMQSNNILKGNILHNTSISLNRLSAGGFGDLKLSRNNKLIANTVTGFSEVAGIMIDGFADTVLVGNHSHHYRIRNCDGLKLIGNSKETTEHGAYFYQNTNVKQDVTDDITT